MTRFVFAATQTAVGYRRRPGVVPIRWRGEPLRFPFQLEKRTL